ncbi:MAG: agmatine deiminase family protein, partial [Gammaproteobacteria bacterium]|nr:agmatine deiminase family protein [Gammaproteobacteria bacterium]
LVASELVYINVLSVEHDRHVRALLNEAGIGSERVKLLQIPTNDAWCRDHGAIFVTREGQAPVAAIDCDYNAWGGKYPPWDLDVQVAGRMARSLRVPKFDGDFVLEGGSIDVNGAGALLTTEQCLLNPNRNPHLDRGEIENRLRALFGVQQIIWLGDGIVGDDTDGHVDDLTRFVSTDTVVTVVEPNSDDDNHAALAENLDRLRSVRLAGNVPLNIVELPMPAAIYHEGQRLPASYANFYIANNVVLMPAFDSPSDAIAQARLAECFSSRRIVPIDCRDLVWGLGAIHCLTQQLPAAGGLATASD